MESKCGMCAKDKPLEKYTVNEKRYKTCEDCRDYSRLRNNKIKSGEVVGKLKGCFETNMHGYEVLPMNKKYSINFEKGSIINTKTKRLLGQETGNGYIMVGINQKKYSIHRIIYESKHGSIPEGMVIDHVDSVKTNNSLSNLEMVTPSENVRRSVKNKDYSFNINNHKNKHKTLAICIETGIETEYQSLYAAQKQLGINSGQITMICENLNRCKTGSSKVDGKAYTFRYIK
jgi:hypothetical protein